MSLKVRERLEDMAVRVQCTRFTDSLGQRYPFVGIIQLLCRCLPEEVASFNASRRASAVTIVAAP